jgi:peroxiredoxin
MSSDRLEQQLDAMRQDAKERYPDFFALSQEAMKQIYETAILDSALEFGATAPDFHLPNAFGNWIRLSDLLRKGMVVLTFYRGDWCPYCNLTLRAFQHILPEILQHGASLVAVSPQSPKHGLSLSTKNQLSYQVLSDSNNMTARAYRLVYQMPEILRRAYEAMGHDMIQQHGSWELPLPATFIIDQNRSVRYRFLNVDYTRRAEPTEILKILSTL